METLLQFRIRNFSLENKFVVRIISGTSIAGLITIMLTWYLSIAPPENNRKGEKSLTEF
jgi:uncharacterized membrane protein